MNSENNTNNSLGIIPIALSKILERFSYYGMRAILVLYLVKQLGFSEEKVASGYWLFLLIVGLMPLIGGLIGDLLIGNKFSTIIGGFIQGAGYFLLAIPNHLALYSGLFLVAFGCGLYSANSVSMLSFIYRDRSQKMDSAVTILYTCINFGAFASQFCIPFVADKFGYGSGFIFCGIFVIVSQLILIFLKNLLKEVPDTANIHLPEITKGINIEIRIIAIIAIIFSMPVFWLIYQLSDYNMYALKSRIGETIHSFTSTSLMIGPMLGVLMGIILSAIWYFVRMSSFLKIVIGLLIYTLSFVVISSVYNNPVSDSLAIFVFIYIFMESIAELFIAPIALSVICQYVPTKFNATLIGVYLCGSAVINYLASAIITGISKAGATGSFIICMIGTLAISVLFLVFYFITRKRVENMKA